LVLGFVILAVALPERYRLISSRLVYGDAALFIAATLAAIVTSPRSLWRRAARPLALAAVAFAFGLNALTLARIADALVTRPRTIEAIPLLHTSVAIWFANILVFTLAYWLIDGGGQEARAEGKAMYYDFDFPARSDPAKLGPDWQPTIMDYLFVAFTTNTAFGPTEAMPLTTRAKALVLVQSLISLVTVIGVAARAIGATSD
jgi:hypothetical protein